MYIENVCFISFCVPCYKVPAEKVKRCIDSIINCGINPMNFEIIIVDDGDDNETFKKLLDVISEYKKQDISLRIVNHARNMSLFEARKSAVHMASGKYICHVDSDDYLEPNSLIGFPDFYAKNEDKWDILQYDFKVIGDDIDKGLHKDKYSKHDEYVSPKSLLKLFTVEKGIPGYIWGKLISKRVCDIAYAKMPDTYVNFSEDYLAMIFLSTYSKTYKTFKNIRLYNYVRNEDSMTSHIKRITLNKWESLLTVKNVIEVTAPSYFSDETVRENVRNHHARLLFELWSTLTLDDAFDPEDKPKATKMFMEAFGEQTAMELNEAFKEKQKEYKTKERI